MHSRKLVPAAMLVLVVLGAAGCVPETVIRRTALVPGVSAPSLSGRPLAKKEAKFAASLNAVSLFPAQTGFLGGAREGDAGLLIPEAQLSASVAVGLTDSFEAGVHVLAAPQSWAAPTSSGVLPLPPGEGLASYTAGVGGRWSKRLGDVPAWLSLSGELNVSNAPQATFVRCGCGGGENEGYVLDHTESNLFLLPNTFLHFGGDLGDHVHLTSFVGVQAALRNVGFEPDASTIDDSTLSTYLLAMYGVGAEARFGGMRVETDLVVPVAHEDLHFSPGLVFRVSSVR